MKKMLWCLVSMHVVFIQAQFVEFIDKSSKNRFLGPDMSMCAITKTGSGKKYQKAYDCGNNTISNLLNLNFLDASVYGQQFYIYNDFMYWMGKNLQSDNNSLSNTQPETHFSGSGVFMIVISTNPYLQSVVAPKLVCPVGQKIIIAQLKYNDGNSINLWSQDAICCAPTDTFSIIISSDEDNTVVPAKSAGTFTDNQNTNFIKDLGPYENYKKADSSPRKIRLIKGSSSLQ